MYGSGRGGMVGGGRSSMICGDCFCFCSVFLVSGFISSVAITEHKRSWEIFEGEERGRDKERQECVLGKAKDYGEYIMALL